MKKTVKAKSYLFSIHLREDRAMGHFEIIANCLADKTKSSITNLNFIIAELIEPIIKFDDYETVIIVDENIGKEIYDKSIELFNDLEWLNQLEIELEEDKSAGEWQ